MSMKTTNRSLNIVVNYGEGSAEDVAVDYVGRNLYWIVTNGTQSSLEVAKLDGSKRTTLIGNIDGKLRGLEIYSPKGYVHNLLT